MKRAAAILVAIMIAAAVLLTITTSTAPQPTLTVTTNHVAVSKFAKTAPVGYSATLNWQMAFAGTTGYFVLNNGTQVADVASSPYTYTGLDCGQSLTFTVQAHNGSGTVLGSITAPYSTPSCGPFPLKVSPNGRFIETSTSTPWLMVGDSPQSTIGDLSVTNADGYLDDRATNGFDAVWFNLLCDSYTFCNANGTTDSSTEVGSIAPFTSGTTPSNYTFGSGLCNNCNTSYFSRAHSIVAHAQADGIEVLLDPIETGACLAGGWMDTLVANGTGTISTTNADYRYGEYLGTTFGDLNNIIWMSGNDFQCIATAANNNDALTVAAGIRATDPTALQTMEPDANFSTGVNTNSTSITSNAGVATGWASTVNLDGAYTYAPTYFDVRSAYAETSTQPAFMVEASYEDEVVGDGCNSGGAPVKYCRLQEWWTMTSGATGQLYGCACTTHLTNANYPNSMDTTGVAQLQVQTNFLKTINWWTLAPDTGNNIVTSGIGSCPTTGSKATVTCVTTSSDYAGAGTATLALTYLPDPSSFASPVVNLASFAGAVTARWLDPTNGSFTPIAGSPFTNSGTHTFTPSTNNAAGDKDWVLVLQG